MRFLYASGIAALLVISAQAKSSEKAVLQLFGTGQSDDRIRLAPALGRMGNKKAVDALLAAFDVKHGNPQETAAIVDALGATRDPRAGAPLASALDYLRSLGLQLGELPANLQVLRMKILDALGRVGGDQAVAILEEFLNDKDNRIVEACVRGLGRLQIKEAIPALQQMAPQGGDLGQAAYEALGEIGDKRAIATLEQGLANSDKFINVESAYALAKLGRKDGVPLLEGALKSDPGMEKVGLLAAYYLAKLDKSSGLEHLEKMIKRPELGYSVYAAEALAKSENPRAVLPLVEAAKSSDSALRLSVARGLGRLGGTRAVATLRKLCDDPNGGVRNAAIASLTTLGGVD
jgi:HEAT repeat protein